MLARLDTRQLRYKPYHTTPHRRQAIRNIARNIQRARAPLSQNSQTDRSANGEIQPRMRAGCHAAFVLSIFVYGLSSHRLRL